MLNIKENQCQLYRGRREKKKKTREVSSISALFELISFLYGWPLEHPLRHSLTAGMTV